jgi:predicted transcriptional regulator
MKLLTIRIEDEDYDRLRELCRRAGIPLSVATRDALRSYERVLQRLAEVREGA